MNEWINKYVDKREREKKAPSPINNVLTRTMVT